MKKRVIVIGSSNIDITIKVPRLPREGETVLGKRYYKAFGGKGANQAIAARKAGANVFFITKLGRDSFGEEYLDYLMSSEIPREGIILDSTYPTGMALIIVDDKGKNQIAVAPGANANLMPDEIYPFEYLFENEAIVLIQHEIPMETVEEALKIAKRNDAMTILNPAPGKKLRSEVLQSVDIITPNEVEAEILTDIEVKNLDDADRAGARLLRMGSRIVIITLGEKGSLLCRRDGSRYFKPFKVKAVDTTAAGDAFNGALACALSVGRDIEEAVIYGNAAGAITVTRMGAQSSLPDKLEIESFLKEMGVMI
ncbi:MAG: ribokinase [Candidatus Aenigmatarchaeota archaeon]